MTRSATLAPASLYTDTNTEPIKINGLCVSINSDLSRQAFNDMLINAFLQKSILYAVTFLIIARYWLSHRHLTNVVEHIDNVYLPLNLLFLAFVAFLPAVTNMIEEYNYVWAVILYTAALAGCGYAMTFLWAYVLKKPLITSNKFSQHSINIRIFNSAVIPTLFLCSLLLLLIPHLNPSHLFFSWFGIPIILFIIKRILSKKATEQGIRDEAWS